MGGLPILRGLYEPRLQDCRGLGRDILQATHKTLANEAANKVTAYEAVAQMSDAYVDDSSVLDPVVTEDDEGIKDVDDLSTPDEDDRTEQADVQNSYKKNLQRPFSPGLLRRPVFRIQLIVSFTVHHLKLSD